MTDVFTKEKRSSVMSRIRGKQNLSTELRTIRLFQESGITGWRRNLPLFGKPDFVFPKKKIVLFIDGCFWHGCSIHAKLPGSNQEFWSEKLAKNKARDLLVVKTLKGLGWRVIRIWEHDLKDASGAAFRRILRVLKDT